MLLILAHRIPSLRQWLRRTLALLAGLFALTLCAHAQETPTRHCISADEYNEIWTRFQSVEDSLLHHYQVLRQRYLDHNHVARLTRRRERGSETARVALVLYRGPIAPTEDATVGRQEVLAESDQITRLRLGWDRALRRHPHRVDILFAMRRIALRMRNELPRNIPGLRNNINLAMDYSFRHMVQAGPQYGCPVTEPSTTPVASTSAESEAVDANSAIEYTTD